MASCGPPQVPAINAHARVSFNEIDTQSGALPVGVQDVNPKSGQVVLIDEDACLTVRTPRAAPSSDSAAREVGRVPDAQRALQCWDTSAAPITPVSNPSFTVEAHLGVVVVLSGAATLPGSYPRRAEDPRRPATRRLRQPGCTAAVDEGRRRPGLHSADRPGGRPAPRVGSVSLFNPSGTCPTPTSSAAAPVHELDVSAAVAFNGPKTRTGRRSGQTSTARTIRSPARRLRPRRASGRRPERFRWRPQSGRRDVFLNWESDGGTSREHLQERQRQQVHRIVERRRNRSQITTNNVGDPLQRIYGATAGGSGRSSSSASRTASDLGQLAGVRHDGSLARRAGRRRGQPRERRPPSATRRCTSASPVT